MLMLFKINKFLVIITTLLLAISVILPFSIFLQAKSTKSYEGLLTAKFANSVSPDTLKSKLKNEFAKEEVNVISLSSKLDIDGQKQTFTLTNQNQLDNNEFLET